MTEPRQCKLDDCQKPSFQLGLCSGHLHADNLNLCQLPECHRVTGTDTSNYCPVHQHLDVATNPFL